MIRIDIDSRPVLDYLETLLARGEDLTPVLDAIGMELESRVSARFETGTDPLGHPWDEWRPATVANYPDNGNRKLLDRYGDMLRSLSHTADATSVTVGFGQPHAAYHEFGTKHMARRGLLTADPDAGTLAPDDAAAILDITQDYFAAT